MPGFAVAFPFLGMGAALELNKTVERDDASNANSEQGDEVANDDGGRHMRGRLTMGMSRDEQRATDARFQHPHDRAARHRLNPFVKRVCAHGCKHTPRNPEMS